MPAGSSWRALCAACVLLVVCCTMGQNTFIDTNLGLDTHELKEESKIQARRVYISGTGNNGMNVVPNASPMSNIEDDVDLGLRPHPLSDMDIKNDVDLGLRHQSNHVGPGRSISDKDIVDDIDLGLTHHGMRKEPIDDKSAKKDVDLALKHEPEKMPISDDDLKNDIDFGLRHTPTKQSISDNDIKDDMDLGLKHWGKSVPIEEDNLTNDNDNDVDLAQRNQERYILKQKRKQARELRLQREQKRKEKISQLKRKMKVKSDRHQDVEQVKKRAMENRRKRNSTRPAIPMAQIRGRTIEETHWKNIRRNLPESELNQLVDDGIKYEKLHEFEREKPQKQQNRQQKSVSGKAHLDDICHQYDVDGCSIPFGLPFPFKELFTNSCNRHDVCYACGSKYSFDRSACDDAFKQNMWKTCVTKYGNGRENITDTRKRQVVNEVEKLREKFDDILRLELEPVMTPNVSQKEDLEKLQNYAKSVQRKVVKEWVDLLREQLYLKKSFSSSNERISIDLIYDRELLQVESEASKNIDSDNNLTTNLCDDILSISSIDNTMASRTVELSCQEIELLNCYFFHYLYFSAVRVFGDFAYHDTPEFYCDQAFVKKCLPH